MGSDKIESPVEVWGARYDDRDAEDLACRRWAAGMTVREQAMAQPFKNFVMADELHPEAEASEAANDASPH